MAVPKLEQIKKWRCRIAENKKLAVSDCRKHKMAVPDRTRTKKMAVSDCRKN